MSASLSQMNSSSAMAWIMRKNIAIFRTSASFRSSWPYRMKLSEMTAAVPSGSNGPAPRSYAQAGMIVRLWKPLRPNPITLKVEPLLLEVADVVNTTLDLDTTLRRVAELVRKVIDYEIFAILLLNEKTQELRVRFQVGLSARIRRTRTIKVGRGVTGPAAQSRRGHPGRRLSTKQTDYIDGASRTCARSWPFR